MLLFFFFLTTLLFGASCGDTKYNQSSSCDCRVQEGACVEKCDSLHSNPTGNGKNCNLKQCNSRSVPDLLSSSHTQLLSSTLTQSNSSSNYSDYIQTITVYVKVNSVYFLDGQYGKDNNSVDITIQNTTFEYTGCPSNSQQNCTYTSNQEHVWENVNGSDLSMGIQVRVQNRVHDVGNVSVSISRFKSQDDTRTEFIVRTLGSNVGKDNESQNVTLSIAVVCVLQNCTERDPTLTAIAGGWSTCSSTLESSANCSVCGSHCVSDRSTCTSWLCGNAAETNKCYQQILVGGTASNTCVTCNSNHSSVDNDNGRCEDKPCADRQSTKIGNTPCGRDECYWDKGNTSGSNNNCISTANCADWYIKQSSNYTCIPPTSCGVRIPNSALSDWPCGNRTERTRCYQDTAGKDGSDKCARVCSADGYEADQETGKCLSSCLKLIPTSGPGFPCEPNATTPNCFLDTDGTNENTCVALCTAPHHRGDTATGKCVLRPCSERTAADITNWPCGNSSEATKCYQDQGGANGDSKCVTACTGTDYKTNSKTGKCSTESGVGDEEGGNKEGGEKTKQKKKKTNPLPFIIIPIVVVIIAVTVAIVVLLVVRHRRRSGNEGSGERETEAQVLYDGGTKKEGERVSGFNGNNSGNEPSRTHTPTRSPVPLPRPPPDFSPVPPSAAPKPAGPPSGQPPHPLSGQPAHAHANPGLSGQAPHPGFVPEPPQ